MFFIEPIIGIFLNEEQFNGKFEYNSWSGMCGLKILPKLIRHLFKLNVTL